MHSIRFLVLALLLLLPAGNAVHAQDIRELTETVKRMQLQLNALQARVDQQSTIPAQLLKLQSALTELEARNAGLEGKVNELQLRLKSFTVVNGNHVLNAGSGSVTIRSASLTFESTGALSLTAGTTANMTFGSTMSMSVGSNASFVSGGALSLKGGISSTLETPGALSLKAGASGVLETANDLLIKTRALHLLGTNNVLLDAPRGAFNFSGTLDIRGSRVDIRNAVINGN